MKLTDNEKRIILNLIENFKASVHNFLCSREPVLVQIRLIQSHRHILNMGTLLDAQMQMYRCNNRAALRSRMAEAAYPDPVYILHQFFIVVPGYFLIMLSVSIPIKYSALLATSVLSTMAIYHFIVRRYTVIRFVFGMKKIF